MDIYFSLFLHKHKNEWIKETCLNLNDHHSQEGKEHILSKTILENNLKENKKGNLGRN